LAGFFAPVFDFENDFHLSPLLFFGWIRFEVPQLHAGGEAQWNSKIEK